VKNKISWIIVLIEIGVIGYLMTKYWNEVKYSIVMLVKPKVVEIIIPKEINNDIKEIETKIINPIIKPIIPTKVPSPTIIIKKIIYPTPTPDNEPWGVARQVDDVTWTMKIGEDEKMATAREIWEALNQYRKVKGSQILNWDTKLADYAQNRAKYLNTLKNVDKHEGFNNFVTNEDGFNKLGFTALGENISYGYKLNGVHTIEWMYAGDKPHNDNQLDNRWNYVGVGVDGLATCLIFGTGKF
jgi:uncharacterized protein YkwD